MRLFFAKANNQKKEEPAAIPSPVFTVAPVNGENIHEHQKRSLVVWLANQIAARLGNGVQGPQVHLWAQNLVEWEERKEDVYLGLKRLQLPERELRCLLDIYNEYGNDFRLYLPDKSKSMQAASSEDEKVWWVYRDVMYAFTQGKFVLIKPEEAERMKKGTLLGSAVIKERQDIPRARELAKELLLGSGMAQSVVMSRLLVISEAVTNILKHATEGTMSIFQTDPCIHVFVEDVGPGFPLSMLPKTTLMAGYSTKKSMGQGFTLMMKMSETIMLSTVPGQGSTLILVFNRSEGEQCHDKHHAG